VALPSADLSNFTGSGKLRPSRNPSLFRGNSRNLFRPGIPAGPPARPTSIQWGAPSGRRGSSAPHWRGVLRCNWAVGRNLTFPVPHPSHATVCFSQFLVHRARWYSSRACAPRDSVGARAGGLGNSRPLCSARVGEPPEPRRAPTFPEQRIVVDRDPFKRIPQTLQLIPTPSFKVSPLAEYAEAGLHRLPASAGRTSPGLLPPLLRRILSKRAHPPLFFPR